MIFNCESFSNVIVVREEQPLNAAASIVSTLAGISIKVNEVQLVNAPFVIFEGIISPIVLSWEPFSKVTDASLRQLEYLQPIITQYFIDNKSEIWLLFLIAHSKRWRFNAFIDY